MDLHDDEALVRLALALRAAGYRFSTVTPATQARVNARPGNAWARSVEDVLGWSRPFRDGVLTPELMCLLGKAGALQPQAEDGAGAGAGAGTGTGTGAGAGVGTGAGWRPTLRASTLQGQLFLHSAYPTTAADAVFFGPDTHRFAAAIERHLAAGAVVRRAVDIGCGAGPGAVTVALARPGAEVFAVDINDKALQLTAINARAAGCTNVQPRRSDLLGAVDGSFDLIVANPPYLLDAHARSYRHGGGSLGEGLSLAIARLAATRLAPGGTLLLYTGSAIVQGADRLRAAVAPALDAAGLHWHYEELDPDVFGEELLEPAYADADRIAAVLLTATRAAAA